MARYTDLTGKEWSHLRGSPSAPISEEDLRGLQGINTPISMTEVMNIYYPVARLVEIHVLASRQRQAAEAAFLGRFPTTRPFIIGLAGSVAVGKSTTARVLRELIARSPVTPHVDLVTTDGFLYPNAVLEERGLMERKGFPESYDTSGLVRFVASVRLGRRAVHPVYSHVTYDVVPGRSRVVERPDVMILEGLNVLQTGRRGRRSRMLLSDFMDFTIFVDADARDVEGWYVERFRLLRDTAFKDPDSSFRSYAELPDDEAESVARKIWESINLVNLRENILPTRERASLILEKAANHTIRRVRIRQV